MYVQNAYVLEKLLELNFMRFMFIYILLRVIKSTNVAKMLLLGTFFIVENNTLKKVSLTDTFLNLWTALRIFYFVTCEPCRGAGKKGHKVRGHIKVRAQQRGNCWRPRHRHCWGRKRTNRHQNHRRNRHHVRRTDC